MSSQDLDGVWTVLATTPPHAGVSVAPTGCSVPAGDILAGVDSESRRHLLIPLLPGEAASTNTKGRGVQLARLKHGPTAYLTVLCLLPELHQVFTQFCRELIDTVGDTASPAREASLALDRWRALFSDAERRGLLSDEALIGLLGELIVVERALGAGAPADLRFWVGPLKQIHDLRSPSHAIEVKASLVREGRIVPISSVDQLQEPTGCNLVLAHIRLDPDPAGFSLPELVDRLLTAGADHHELMKRLHDTGVTAPDLSAYASRTFRISEVRAYDVLADAFPRLLRSSFASGDIPAGTLRISYSIDLTNVPPVPLAAAELEKVIADLAVESSSAVDT